MKQNKFMRFMTSRALILTLQVVASGVLLYFVYLTKLLPVKYFAILAAVLAALVLLFWIIIQTGKKKIVEGKTSKRTIISKVLSLIVSIVLVIGSTFAARGNTFLNNVQTTTQKYAINVIVLKDGDVISVIAKNNNLTLSQSLKNIYYTISGEELHIVAATGSGIIAINGAT